MTAKIAWRLLEILVALPLPPLIPLNVVGLLVLAFPPRPLPRLYAEPPPSYHAALEKELGYLRAAPRWP